MFAIFNEQPYVLITPNQELKVSLAGDKKEIEQALRLAMENTPALRTILNNALKEKRQNSIVRSNYKFNQVPA